MRLALAYPGHYTSTYDVAHGYEAGLREAGMEVWPFGYHSCLAFYRVALEEWEERNKDFRWEKADQHYLATRSGVADLVEREPDAAIVVHGLNLHPCYYAALHRLGIPFALLLTESPYQDREQLEMCAAVQPDAVFVNDRASLDKYERWNAHYLPQSYDPAIHFGSPDTERVVHVSFVGTLYPERKRLLDAINWDELEHTFVAPQMEPEGERWANDKVAELYRRSMMVLNLNRTVRGYHEQDQHIAGGEAYSIAARAYEIPACGALMLSEYGRGELRDVYGYDCPTFKGPKELAESIYYYLMNGDERVKMARRQQDKARPCRFVDRANTIVIPVLEGMNR